MRILVRCEENPPSEEDYGRVAPTHPPFPPGGNSANSGLGVKGAPALNLGWGRYTRVTPQYDYKENDEKCAPPLHPPWSHVSWGAPRRRGVTRTYFN